MTAYATPTITPLCCTVRRITRESKTLTPTLQQHRPARYVLCYTADVSGVCGVESAVTTMHGPDGMGYSHYAARLLLERLGATHNLPHSTPSGTWSMVLMGR